MELKNVASAGTLESSDVQIIIEPKESGLDLAITSSVLNQYGKQIRTTVIDTLKDLQVENAKVTVTDKGALDCIIKARVQCAVFRSAGIKENYPWGGLK